MQVTKGDLDHLAKIAPAARRHEACIFPRRGWDSVGARAIALPRSFGGPELGGRVEAMPHGKARPSSSTGTIDVSVVDGAVAGRLRRQARRGASRRDVERSESSALAAVGRISTTRVYAMFGPPPSTVSSAANPPEKFAVLPGEKMDLFAHGLGWRTGVWVDPRFVMCSEAPPGCCLSDSRCCAAARSPGSGLLGVDPTALIPWRIGALGSTGLPRVGVRRPGRSR